MQQVDVTMRTNKVTLAYYIEISFTLPVTAYGKQFVN